MNNNNILSMVGDFSWGFNHLFHIEVNIDGKLIFLEWSDPDYGGDNSIKFATPLSDWITNLGIPFTRDKGKHVIGDYCPGARLVTE